MSDELKHECAVAMVVLRRPPSATGDFGGTKLSLLLEKQHNRGQDGAGAAILSSHPESGSQPYWLFKSASSTALVDLLGAIAKRNKNIETANGQSLDISTVSQSHNSTIPYSRIFLGHLRYATFGKNDVAFCHPFVHQASELEDTLLLAGNFNLTNASELFDDYRRHGAFPTSKSDGYLITELVSHELTARLRFGATRPTSADDIVSAVSKALANADGAWTLCGATGDGWAFATRDPHGIRPGFCYIDNDVVVIASERPAIQAAFDVPPEAVKELPPGKTLVISPEGEVLIATGVHHAPVDVSIVPAGLPHAPVGVSNVPAGVVKMSELCSDKPPTPSPCSFERIYFSRANDADIHRERKALGAALLPQILSAANAPIEDIFFSYIPNSARIAFHGLLEELFKNVDKIPRFGEIAVKDAKFRTFIADAAARREFYKHVYDVTYGLVRPGKDTLVVLDDSIVRGNTMKNAILPMLDRLGPKRIVIASSAPPIRYPDCYGIDMSTLNELVAFRALVNLLDHEGGDGTAEKELKEALEGHAASNAPQSNPLDPLYARFTEEEHSAEIARLLTPPDMKAEVVVVYQTIDSLRQCLTPNTQLSTPNSEFRIGDWYFTGDYPTPGGYKVLHKALANYLSRSTDRSY